MPERWERQLDKLDLLEPPARLGDRIGEPPPRGADTRPGRRVAIIVVAFVIFLFAGAFAWVALRPAPLPVTSPAAQPKLPDVGQVTCAQEGPTTTTPRFQVQSDGVHFSVDNIAGLDEVVIVGQGGLNGAYSADIDLSQGSVAHYAELPPGDIEVGCYTDHRLRGVAYRALPAQGNMTAMSIEDPSGFYVPHDLQCGGTGQEEIGPAQADADPTQPSDFIRAALSGIEPTDVIEQTGYLAYREGPFQIAKGGNFRIVRGGRVIGTARLEGDEHFSLLARVEVCGDSGIAKL